MPLGSPWSSPSAAAPAVPSDAQRALRQRDRALQAAVNGVVIADATVPGFPITYVNAGFERMTGYRAEEVLGRSCAVLQGPDTDPDAVEAMRAALRRGDSVELTVLNYRKDGRPFWNDVHLSPVRDDEGRLVEYIGVQNDVTARRRAEDQVAHLAYHDPLTGLGNRTLLAEHAERALERARSSDHQVALLCCDVDDFKTVNDTLGHVVGDRLLVAIADRLRTVVRASDLLVRQGGDEFLLLLPDIEGDARAVAVRVAEAVAEALRRPFSLAGDEGSSSAGERVAVTTSIGISVFPADCGTAAALISHADTAMYSAKRSGGGHALWHPGVTTEPAAPGIVEPATAQRFASILAARDVRPAYQPIVDLEAGGVVAYEALARGPEGPLASPLALFATARALGRLRELDDLCRTEAVNTAVRAGLPRRLRLFVNVEPQVVGAGELDLFADIERPGAVDVVVEITERALTARPADLLTALARIRERGWAIALDDVGADPRSLALMPLLRPDVIKLDISLVQQQPTAARAAIASAVAAQRERSGAVLLAEGIEDEGHLRMALGLGASLGQGWYFGRPRPLPTSYLPPPQPLLLTPALPSLAGTSPYEVVAPLREVRTADKALLLAMSHRLEQQAITLGDNAVVLSAFQDASRFTAATHRRYASMAARAAFVAAFGIGMEAEPAPGVRGAQIADDDILAGEWSVVVLGSHFAGALVATDLGDDGPDHARRFDYVLTHDRDLVVAAAESLLRRVTPIG